MIYLFYCCQIIIFQISLKYFNCFLIVEIFLKGDVGCNNTIIDGTNFPSYTKL